MWLQAGLGLASGITDFITKSREAKYREKLQAYNNAMVNLSNATNQNAITTNQNAAIERSVVAGFQQERTRFTTIAEAEVSAAASDTAGRSVNQTLYQIERSAEEAESARLSDLEMQVAGFDQQRVNSAVQASQQIDRSYIPQPNPVTAMLGMATDFYKVTKRYNPKTI